MRLSDKERYELQSPRKIKKVLLKHLQPCVSVRVLSMLA